MTEEITLRRARSSDILPLSELENACFSDPWSENSIRSQLDGEYNISTVAELDGIIIGYVFMQCLAPECEIYRVAVCPKMRRLGIGEKILDYSISLAKSIGGTDFFLEVRESNTAARKLYEKAGLKSVAERRNYYNNPTENALIMCLQS